jgi:hypothetical protein
MSVNPQPLFTYERIERSASETCDVCGGSYGFISEDTDAHDDLYECIRVLKQQLATAQGDAARWQFVRKRGVVVPTMTLPHGEHIAEGVVGDGYADRCVDVLIAKAARP